MLDFYERLMEIADEALESKFIFGKKFNRKERFIIYRYIDTLKFTDDCPQRTICISVPAECFDINKFKKENEYPDKIKYKNTKTVISLIFDNKNKNFDYTNLWDIKRCSNRPIEYYVEWETITDNYIFIFFHYDPDLI